MRDLYEYAVYTALHCEMYRMSKCGDKSIGWRHVANEELRYKFTYRGTWDYPKINRAIKGYLKQNDLDKEIYFDEYDTAVVFVDIKYIKAVLGKEPLITVSIFKDEAGPLVYETNIFYDFVELFTL